MNKVYRTVFNEKTNTWVAVSEVTKAHGKSGVSGNVVSTVLDGVLFDKKMLAVSTAVAAALASQTAMAANARIENGSAQWTIAVSPSGSDVGGNGSAKATGKTSIAAGWDAKADGENSIAVGYGASTETNSATYYRIKNVPDKTMNNIAIGKQARSGGLQTIAFGSESVASKSQSIAFGFDAQATGDQSVALGANTRSVGDSSIAIGGDDLDSVASTVYRMTSPSADNDAYNDTALAKQYRTLTGQNLVNFTPGNRYIGTSTGQAGVAVGVSAKAADLSTAVGAKSHATGEHSVALGVGANATLTNAVALGAGSTTATNAIDVPSATIGAITYGGGASPFAGSGKVVPGDQVSVGAAGFERQIKHVAPGAITAASTDAINGSQLFYVAKGLQEQITAAGGNGIHFYHVNGANTDNNYNNDGATGSKALAAGINAKAAGASSVAVGSAEVAEKSVVGQSNSEGAVAIGDSAYAAGRQAVTLGASRAEEEQAVAIGSNARSSGKASMAIGAGAVASQENSISIGSSANAAGNNSVSIGADSSTVAAAAGSVALGHTSQATRAAIDATKVQANAAPTVANNQVYALASASNADQNNITATVKGELGAVSVGTQNGTRQIINVAAGTADSDAVNVAQLKAVANQITTQAVATTPLTVTNGKVTPPATADQGKLATAGDIANAINNSGFQATAGGRLASGTTATATTVKPGQKVTFAAGNGLTVKQDVDGTSGDQTYTYALDAQTVVQNAQTPVVYTDANGNKVYKHTDGNFYTQPNGGGTQVAAGDVIASMQDAAGNTTAPTTLANVKGNLADTSNATGNPSGNDRATLAAGNKGNNAATVNDVLNAGFTVQGNGTDKDFVTHGDTINFANGQGTVANVSTTNGVTTVKFDTPMTYADATGNPTNTPSNKVNLVGGTAGSPVTLGNVADGNIAAGSKEAINGGQLHDLKENGFKISDGTTTDTVKLTETVTYKGDSNIVTTVTDNQVGFKLADSITVGPATGGNPVKIDGNAGTVTGLTNKAWDPANITSGRGATEDQLKAAQAAATSKVAAGNGISVTPNVDATTGSTTYTVAADTTTLNVGDGTGGNPAGKVITPTGADANKLATAGDIANAINNSGFNINAGGNVVGTSTATTAKPGSTLTLKAGDGLTVKQELDGNGNQSYTYALDSQSVVQNAQTPVVYTDANGNKVYKHTDGNFYTQPNGGGTQVAAGDVIASMQDAAGNTTAPTTLANVKGNLADTSNATGNPSGNDRATLAAGNKGNNAATVNDVLNAGFTVQGNGTDKDFVTHGDTINFANGQGTVANVSTTNGVTTVKFDTPMTYADATGNPTNTPSNKVNLVGGTAGSPVTLGNVAPGTLSTTSTEAVNGSQLYATNQNVAKGINFGGTTGSNNYQLGDTINVKGDSNITSTTVNGGVQLGLNPNLNVTSVTATDAAGNQTVTNGGGVTITPAAGGGNPVSLTTGGLNNGGNKITNVAPGEISATSTDAVNGSQLHNAINNSVGNVAGAVENLQNRMGKLQDDSEAGTASALAAAGLPQAYLPGKSMIAVSGSTYRGQQGYAVGMSAISDSGNWIVKGTATGNSRGHFGATIGAGYQW